MLCSSEFLDHFHLVWACLYYSRGGSDFRPGSLARTHEQAESLNVILVVDNHRIHFGQTSRDKVSELGWSYPVTQFPAYGPDLQPLENLFAVINNKMFKGPPPKGRKTLEGRLRKVLQDLSRDESRDLIRKFRNRCEEVEKEDERLDY